MFTRPASASQGCRISGQSLNEIIRGFVLALFGTAQHRKERKQLNRGEQQAIAFLMSASAPAQSLLLICDRAWNRYPSGAFGCSFMIWLLLFSEQRVIVFPSIASEARARTGSGICGFRRAASRHSDSACPKLEVPA